MRLLVENVIPYVLSQVRSKDIQIPQTMLLGLLIPSGFSMRAKRLVVNFVHC
jgi:hypothetical protein